MKKIEDVGLNEDLKSRKQEMVTKFSCQNLNILHNAFFISSWSVPALTTIN